MNGNWNWHSHILKILCKVWPWSVEIYRLATFLTPTETEFFQFLSRFCTYVWGIYSLKNNSAVSRSGYLHGLNQQFSLTNAFVFFSTERNSLKYIKKRNSTSLLSKSTLKHLVYCQVFWLKVRRLQSQCISIWAVVFYYCISNNMPHEKTVMQT